MLETVNVSSINSGDEIEVDLGKGKTFRYVDKIADGPNDTLIITLYSEKGVRPKIIIKKGDIVRRYWLTCTI